MLTITDGGSLSRALSSSLDPGIKRLLRLRCKQLGGDITHQARFVIVQPGDGCCQSNANSSPRDVDRSLMLTA
jgi:hypothetical protein